MNSEERHLFDELQAELVDFKTKMKDKEEFLNQQVRIFTFQTFFSFSCKLFTFQALFSFSY